jgi:hypothetical protein
MAVTRREIAALLRRSRENLREAQAVDRELQALMQQLGKAPSRKAMKRKAPK